MMESHTPAKLATDSEKNGPIARIRGLLAGKRAHWIAFFAILLLGIFARTWEYRSLPPGLFADEASMGVDSYYIGRYGIDRNGVSYPTQLTAFGQEQNALYAYLILPMIAAWGLKVIIIRLPMLISAILTMPLVYWLTRRIFNERLGLLSLFFLAVSPWHILLSRWGLDQNLLPSVFTLAFVLLIEATHNSKWMIPACILFGLCFYIYGPSYFIVPFVLAFSTWLLLRRRLIDKRHAAAGVAVFCLLAVPISVFLLVNSLGLPAVKLGAVTIPRMPSIPRFLSQTGNFRGQIIQALGSNLWIFVRLLLGQTDGLIYNAFEPFGYFYKITFPLELLGIGLLFQAQRREGNVRKTMLLLWVSACLVFGMLQPVNINRINTIFIPLIICTALAIDWLATFWRPVLAIAVVAVFAGFLWFTTAYHGRDYRAMIDRKFHAGLLEAITFASEKTPGPVCVTDKIDMPYIYVLFAEKPDPRAVLSSIQYVPSPNPLRPVRSLTRYTFGTENCTLTESPVFVLTTDENPPHFGRRYIYEFFHEYVVYFPKP